MADSVTELGTMLCQMSAPQRVRYLTSLPPADMRLAEQAWAKVATARGHGDAQAVRAWLRDRALELIGPAVDRLAAIIGNDGAATADQLRAISTVMQMATSGLQGGQDAADGAEGGRDLDREIEGLLAAIRAESEGLAREEVG